MNLNIDAIKSQTFDAIVVGSGISGGWAAKELTEKGLKVAVLERGREIKHIEGYETALKTMGFCAPRSSRQCGCGRILGGDAYRLYGQRGASVPIRKR